MRRLAVTAGALQLAFAEQPEPLLIVTDRREAPSGAVGSVWRPKFPFSKDRCSPAHGSCGDVTWIKGETSHLAPSVELCSHPCVG